MYVASIWFPYASPSLILQLQNIQNSALRIATGSVKMTSIDHFTRKLECFLSKITFTELAPNNTPEVSNLTTLSTV